MLGKHQYKVSHSDSEDSGSENEMLSSILKKGNSLSPRSDDIQLDFLEKLAHSDGSGSDGSDGSDGSGSDGSDSDGSNSDSEGEEAAVLPDKEGDESESEISDWGVRSVSSDDCTDPGDERSYARSRSGSRASNMSNDSEKFEYDSDADKEKDADKNKRKRSGTFGSNDFAISFDSEASGSEGDKASDSEASDSEASDSEGDDALSVRSFVRDELNDQLKRFELNRTDFDIACVMLYINDLADVMGVEPEEIAFRLSRYINTTEKDYSMKKDTEASYAAINSFASLLGDPSSIELADRVDHVATAVSKAVGESEEFGFTYAVPLVLNSLESSHPDVRRLVGKLSKPTDKVELFPIPIDEATSIRSKLDTDESGALKTFRGLRTIYPKNDVVPIGFSLTLEHFESALRKLGSKGIQRVMATIPIEGENLESLVVDEESDKLDRSGSDFVRGEPLALTISELPYSQLTYNHIFVDE